MTVKSLMTRNDIIGGILVMAGLTLIFLPYYLGNFTLVTLTVGCVVMIIGAYLVVPATMREALDGVGDAVRPWVPVARTSVEKAGRRRTDPEVPVQEIEPEDIEVEEEDPTPSPRDRVRVPRQPGRRPPREAATEGELDPSSGDALYPAGGA